MKQDYNKKYYQDNKDKLIENQKEYYKKNQQKRKQYNKSYYKQNKEVLCKKQRDYNKTDKGKIVDSNKRHKRRAQMKQTDITNEWLLNLKQNSFHCPICSCELNEIQYDSQSKNLDHIIPLNIGGKHIMNNVRYICQSCNLGRPEDGSDL